MDTQNNEPCAYWGRLYPCDIAEVAQLGREALAVWCVVVGHSNEDGEAYPSDRRMRKLSGLVDGRNVERGVQALTAAGILEVTRVPRTSTVYRLTRVAARAVTADTRSATQNPVTAALPANVTADTRSALTADTRSEQRRNKEQKEEARERAAGSPSSSPSLDPEAEAACSVILASLGQVTAQEVGDDARERVVRALNEGHAPEDLLRVIAWAAAVWTKDPKFAKHITAPTLFGKKVGEYIGKATAWAKESGYQSDAEQRADEQAKEARRVERLREYEQAQREATLPPPEVAATLAKMRGETTTTTPKEPAAEDGAGDTPAEDDAQPPADDPARGFDIPESLRERMIPANPADLAGVPLPGAAVPDLRRRRSKGAADDRRAASRDRGPSWRSRPADLPPIHGQDVRVDGAGVARLGGGAGAGPASPSSRQRSGLERLEGRPEPGRAGGAGRGPARVCPLRWRGRRPPGAPHQVAPGRTDYPAGWLRTASRRRGSGTARRSALRPSDRQAHGRIARGSSPPGEPPAGSPPWSERPRGAPAAVVRRDHGAENSTPWSRRVVIARPFGVACGTVTTSFITTSFIGRPDPVAGPGERFALFKWRAIGPAPLAPTIPDAGR